MIDTGNSGDYNGHMIVNLRESKARLSELVELACRGEDILITVRGKVRARLSRAADAGPEEMAAWAQELARQQKRQKVSTGLSVEQILELDREDGRG